MIQLGKVIKNFSALSDDGEKFEIKSVIGKRLVLYFYPKDSTPGCTTEAQEFNKLLPQFKKNNALIIGVSRDSIASHQKFKEKYELKFPLLSDHDEKICQLFDVIKEKNMYGKKVMGIERSTFIIDEKGQLVAEFRKVKALGHAQAVLEKIKSL